MVTAAIASLLLCGFILWAPLGPVAPGGLAAVSTLAALAVGSLRGLRPALLILLVGLPSALCALTVQQNLAGRWPPDRAGTDLTVTGGLCGFPRAQPSSWRFVLEPDPASRAQGAPARILVSWYDSVPLPAAGPPDAGQVWRLTLRLRPPRGLVNPGGFDFERWLFSRGIGATGWVRPGDNERLAGQARGCRAAPLRARLARELRAALADDPALPYILGLAIGASEALPVTEWDRLRRTGTVHLISISGFHVALVAVPGAFLGLSLAGLSLRFGVSVRPRAVAAWFAVVPAIGYGALAGFSIPTLRAVVALVTVAVAVTLARALSVSRLLALVMIMVLVLEPVAVLAPGFWLSFAGVAILTVVALDNARPSAVRESGNAIRRLIAGPLRLLIVTQLAVTVGLAPLLVLFFGQLPLTGTLANLVAVPAFSLVLLPLTLMGTALLAAAPGLGLPVLKIASACFAVWGHFLQWCSDLPVAVWYTPAVAPLNWALALAGVVWVLWPRPAPGRCLASVLLSALLWAPGPSVVNGSLRVLVLDVGQGLSVLVRTAGHSLLYDAGPAFRNSDAGERVVVPALQALGLRRLDTLLVSHSDADHSGGAAAVLERYPMTRSIGWAPPGVAAEPCRAGMRWHWDGFDFEIVHPVAGQVPLKSNAASCVLVVSGHGARLLLPGDIDAAVERELVARGAIHGSDLVLAPHHGSRTSSSDELVQASLPRFVLFSTGFGNRWKFPRPDVAGRWSAAGACLLNTAEEGAIEFESTPGAAFTIVRRERAAARGVWLMRPAMASPCGRGQL